MRISQLTARIVSVPMKREIRHASHSRRDSDNVIVQCQLEDGTVGFGEGVPRSYVTGETAPTALAMFEQTDFEHVWDTSLDDWAAAIDVADSISFPTSDDPRGCRANSLRCAVELAIFDAVGTHLRQPLRRVIDHLPDSQTIRQHHDQVRYSTTITSQSPAAERRSAMKMWVYGFHQCKVKVGVDGQDDAERLKRMRYWLGRRVDIRVDANEAWTPEQTVRQVRCLEPANISCIEQPVLHENFESLPDIRRDINTDIMLDESLTSLIDGRAAIDSGACDCFNIRLSKCGGYLNCLRLASMAQQANLTFQLGCHPGETPILSAAGRHFASSVGPIRYLEGSYDRHLLAESFASPDITFKYGGRAPAIERPGLGIAVDMAAIERHCQDAVTRTGFRHGG